ncbi:uncharacterized protein Tco025E_09727 [Trypanosoma conorhini]|uniref:Uncharacterized protein n=1 Tax=Trypanosoma conorhini TaxID=83891 RepID=A0A3R7N597_9TRYP|nr:uncharacterized protein Tco025E_09727 [Trypanosoma conorhini]RNE96716.1 hypothetical protein Tco025E_09727 [Trypanosoma conorhini]
MTDHERSRLTAAEAERRAATKAVYLTQQPPSMRFAIGFAAVLFLILCLPLQSALVAYLRLRWGYRNGFAVTTIVVLGVYPIAAVPFRFLDRSWKCWRPPTSEGEGAAEQHEPASDRPAAAPPMETDYVAPQYQTRFIQSLCTAKLWAIFWSLFCTLGTEFVILTNSRLFFLLRHVWGGN